MHADWVLRRCENVPNRWNTSQRRGFENEATEFTPIFGENERRRRFEQVCGTMVHVFNTLLFVRSRIASTSQKAGGVACTTDAFTFSRNNTF